MDIKMKIRVLRYIIIVCISILVAGCGKDNQLKGIEKEDTEVEFYESGDEQTVDDVKPAEMETDKMNSNHDKKVCRDAIFVNGSLYITTENESDIGARCGVMDGEITSSVAKEEYPVKDNQSNFSIGYGYQHVDENNIDVYIDEKWMRFVKEITDIWGVRMSARDICPSGITLVCEQSGGDVTGDLQTGSKYELEVQKNDQWIPVETLSSEYERAWTDEAWIISKDSIVEWKVNWMNLYGELADGKYRICKEVMDFRGTGDYDVNTYYAYFEVVN